MLTHIHPKLPMRNIGVTKDFYIKTLGFTNIGSDNFDGYLMLQKDKIELHFFLFKELVPKENYGQVYIRVNEIENFYNALVKQGVPIHPNGALEIKPWRQIEFSILDPDTNLLTFGQSI